MKTLLDLLDILNDMEQEELERVNNYITFLLKDCKSKTVLDEDQ